MGFRALHLLMISRRGTCLVDGRGVSFKAASDGAEADQVALLKRVALAWRVDAGHGQATQSVVQRQLHRAAVALV